jgi:hypothetical protein
MLPKMLPGAVRQQWVRCGRPGCRCGRRNLHGPYYYRFWRNGGRLRKEYVRAADVGRVRAECQARRQPRQELTNWREVWRQLAAQLREVEQR